MSEVIKHVLYHEESLGPSDWKSDLAEGQTFKYNLRNQIVFQFHPMHHHRGCRFEVIVLQRYWECTKIGGLVHVGSDPWMCQRLKDRSFEIEYPKCIVPAIVLDSLGNGEVSDKVMLGFGHEFFFDLMKSESEDSCLHRMIKTHFFKWYSWFLKNWYHV